jgi:alanyl-tRNA synthetase
MLTSDEIRRSYVDFFTRRGHTEIPGASLIGDGDTLFTIAGMQPLIPYFSGSPHPAGRRLVDYQRCLRTVDIDEVGDASHLTCFEMLGNWSLGDYFKRESLGWTLEWLTEVLGIDRSRLSVTVFAGDEQVPFDGEARDRWLELGISAERIRALGREENWWGPPGPDGPCGSDSEIFYLTDGGEWMELGNNVFIAYEQMPDGEIRPLAQRNVDVGLGLERITCLLQGVDSVYETDLFTGILGVVRGLASVGDVRAERIVCDHVRSGVLLIGDGVLPSNRDQGYVLRRLLRRAIRQGRVLGIDGPFLRELGESVIERYRSVYPQLDAAILEVLEGEERRFARTLKRGLREIKRLEHVDGRELFRLFETYGLPPELTLEELGVSVDRWRESFDRAADDHRERSRRDPR